MNTQSTALYIHTADFNFKALLDPHVHASGFSTEKSYNSNYVHDQRMWQREYSRCTLSRKFLDSPSCRLGLPDQLGLPTIQSQRELASLNQAPKVIEELRSIPPFAPALLVAGPAPEAAPIPNPIQNLGDGRTLRTQQNLPITTMQSSLVSLMR